jgi:hypothetical protein
MQQTISILTAVTKIATLALFISVTSCHKEPPARDHGCDPLKVKTIPIYNKVVDANGHAAVADTTLLFDAVGNAPVKAPDGHQITLGEFNMASGQASVKCIQAGTHVVIHLEGLIPNGVYTIWTMTLKSPGYDGTFANVIGVGALGAPDGSQNAFTASAHGMASLSVTAPGGNLSAVGSVGNCFNSEFEVLLSTAYHLDGLTHGGVPGDEATWVFQSAFPIFGADIKNDCGIQDFIEKLN